MNPPHTQHEDAVPLNTDARIAVMSVQITHVLDGMARIEASNAGHVTRSEWEQRNAYSDGRFLDINTKLAEAAARKAPWWAVVGAGAGIAAGAAFLFDIIPKLVN